MKTITLRFEDKEFKKLSNSKELAVITLDGITSWESFILHIAKVKNGN